VNWLIDNAVLVSFLVALVAVLISLVVLGIRIGGAYRRVRVATKTLSVAGGALADDVHRVVAALAALPDRQAEVQQAITELSQRAAAVGVLARHAMAAHRILRSPLWFVGR
jgi:cell division protein FtsB